MLEAQITRSQSHFDVSKIRYDAHEKAMNDYTNTTFKAAQTASLSYLDAAIKEQVDNAAAAKNIYKREWDYYEGLIATATISNAVSVYNTALTHKNTVNVNSEIAVAELANKVVRVATDLVTAAKYKIAENVVWGTYYVTTIATEVKYLASYIKTETTFGTAKKDADEAFDVAVIPAWLCYSMDLRAWEASFIAAVAHCADPNFVAANWFNIGTNTVAGDFTFVTLRTTGDNGGNSGNDDTRSWFNSPYPIPKIEPKLPKGVQVVLPKDGVGLPSIAPRNEHGHAGGENFPFWDGGAGFRTNAMTPPIKYALDKNDIIPKEVEKLPELQPFIEHQKAMDAKVVAPPDAITFTNKGFWDPLHTVLDFFGLIPLAGEPADALNGVIYTVEGDKTNAALSFGATLPIVGIAGVFGKWGKRIFFAADAGGGAGGKIVVEAVQEAGGKGGKVAVEVVGQLHHPITSKVSKQLQGAENISQGFRLCLKI